MDFPDAADSQAPAGTAAGGLEGTLLAALSRGETAAFWPLWQRYSRHLFFVCLAQMKGNRADAEDAHAQAMMTALRKLPRQASTVRNVEAWLTRLTSNLCRDIHRQRERSLRAVGHWHALAGNEPVAPPPDAPAPDQELDPLAIVARLPPRLQHVFVMRFLQQLPYCEIAGRLQLTPATVRKRVQEARALLRSWIGQGPGAPPPPAAARPDDVPAQAAAVVVQPFTREVGVRTEGGKVEVRIVLGHRPSREGQKIATLRAYVAEHPAGWKKRLALGDLLYQTGAWQEAAACYRIVLAKRPWMREVAARLEQIDGVLAAPSG
jgi:RNA polymerase sigma-70 factor (ECF subfamily)